MRPRCSSQEKHGGRNDRVNKMPCVSSTLTYLLLCVKNSGIRSCSTTNIVSRLLVVQNLRQPIVIRHRNRSSMAARRQKSANVRPFPNDTLSKVSRICQFAVLLRPQDRNHKKAGELNPSRRAPRSDQLPSPHPTCPILSDKPRRNKMRHFPPAMAPAPIVIAFRSGGMSVSVPRAKRPTCSKSWL